VRWLPSSRARDPHRPRSGGKRRRPLYPRLGFEQVDLFGFSVGGVIAQVIAQAEPQLVGERSRMTSEDAYTDRSLLDRRPWPL
jgi:pimeloyl-ACP methyl ester carboxylesterase